MALKSNLLGCFESSRSDHCHIGKIVHGASARDSRRGQQLSPIRLNAADDLLLAGLAPLDSLAQRLGATLHEDVPVPLAAAMVLLHQCPEEQFLAHFRMSQGSMRYYCRRLSTGPFLGGILVL
ncbi:uncharacterized protein MYCGRDRAFT_102204 [Zymoseptoria tritici IPO323]|uniref:Uncharacterized protein n=1 Tax=Zymoseptoria tritici (strain CBS 115943 / IPO323) TaxID=336722 RepID=F9WWB9_ZYMTI|nr:uncharacterized protein MYCGRDRAFT_102204 [Zymoseptoria tritici IPO323]EGP92534.1 hypothetical protein MYCGRDRAFT_102204 [Zymoseptoria tritici IPO323]